MPLIVHPEGWRLYYKKAWRSNFFIKFDPAYYSVFHKTKAFYEIINLILSKLSFQLNKKRDLLEFNNFKIYTASNSLFIIINISFLLKNFLKEITVFSHRADMFPESYYKLLFRKNIENPFTTKSFPPKAKFPHFIFENIFFKYPLEDEFKNLLPLPYMIHNHSYFKFLTHCIFFFSILPLFCFIKIFINTSILNLLKKKNYKTQVYFVGSNPLFFLNPNRILNKTLYYLTEKEFSPRRALKWTIIELQKLYPMYKKTLKGYKVVLAGRFTRKDRAVYLWRHYGSIPNNTKLANIDYSYKYLNTIYGRCIIQLWLCY